MHFSVEAGELQVLLPKPGGLHHLSEGKAGGPLQHGRRLLAIGIHGYNVASPAVQHALGQGNLEGLLKSRYHLFYADALAGAYVEYFEALLAFLFKTPSWVS